MIPEESTCSNPDHRDGLWETVSLLGLRVAELTHNMAIIACNLALADKAGDIGAFGRQALKVAKETLKENK